MTDLDFDELDQAVNSLMADVDTSKRPAGLDDPIDTAVTLAPSTPAANDDAVTTPIATSDSPTQEPTAAAAPPAIKRRGQFMDVMHPSSDMKTTPMVSRQGVGITPLSVPAVAPPPVSLPEEEPAVDIEPANVGQSPEVVADEPVMTESLEITDTPADDQPVVDEATAPEAVTETEMPSEDLPSMDEALSMAEEPATVPVVPVETVETIEETAPVAMEPSASPFLPDAKVDKRPLGSPVSSEETALLSESEPVTDPEPVSAEAAPTETKPEDTPAPDIHLPDELQGDIVSIESSTPKPVETLAAEPATPIAPMSTNGSILQQYTEQPTSTAPTNGAIYDTAAYHQPLDVAPPAKKKTSVLKIVLWVFLLLVLGAAIGAGVFYFTTMR